MADTRLVDAIGPPPRPRASALTRVVSLIAGLLLLSVLIAVALQWWTRGRFIQSTNDAYLQADQVSVASKVQGYVEDVLVRDNEHVSVGQPLVRINADSFMASLAQQQAILDARRADILTVQRQVLQSQAAVARAEAELTGAQATFAYAQGEAKRFQTLAAQGVETDERAAQASNQADQANAALRSHQAELRQTTDQVATQQAQISEAEAQLAGAAAQLANARLTVGDSVLRSSISGVVGDKTVRIGQYVQPGMKLLSVVPVSETYLVANFKETQIARMRIGQYARVKIDALGGRVIDAVLESFAPGTGSQFALLPPENATGNFTKVVQRVPVRLRLQASHELRYRLLPGLSATVRIDTTEIGSPPELRERLTLDLAAPKHDTAQPPLS